MSRHIGRRRMASVLTLFSKSSLMTSLLVLG
jgi:hypothetical protein